MKKSVISLFFSATPLFSYSLSLSQNSVVKAVLQNSLEYQKIKTEQKASEQNLIESEAFLDWHLFAQARFNSEEQNTLNFFENPFQKSWTIFSGVEKKFLTGTYIKIQYSHFQFEKDFNPEFKKISTSPDTTFRQKLGLEVEQDILRNIFGYADRMRLNIANAQAISQNLKLLEKTEDLILQAIQQFWTTYISYLSLELKIAKKKDYNELARITKEKSQYGYVRPGELGQILAEQEKTKQELILQKTDYAEQLKKLLNLLNIQEENIPVHFVLQNKLPSLPVLSSSLKQTPRKVLLMQKNLFIQKQKLEIQKSNTWPTLKLFGSYEIGGYDTNFSSAFEGLTERKNQNHSFGIKFSYPLPSSRVRSQRIDINEQAVFASELQTKITEKEFNRLINRTQKNLLALHSALSSSEKIHKLRARSYKEIRKAFLQGRLSVFELISAKELSLVSKMEKTRINAQYHQALAYAQAVRDQLITEYQ